MCIFNFICIFIFVYSYFAAYLYWKCISLYIYIYINMYVSLYLYFYLHLNVSLHLYLYVTCVICMYLSGFLHKAHQSFENWPQSTGSPSSCSGFANLSKYRNTPYSGRKNAWNPAGHKSICDLPCQQDPNNTKAAKGSGKTYQFAALLK